MALITERVPLILSDISAIGLWIFGKQRWRLKVVKRPQGKSIRRRSWKRFANKFGNWETWLRPRKANIKVEFMLSRLVLNCCANFDPHDCVLMQGMKKKLSEENCLRRQICQKTMFSQHVGQAIHCCRRSLRQHTEREFMLFTVKSHRKSFAGKSSPHFSAIISQHICQIESKIDRANEEKASRAKKSF